MFQEGSGMARSEFQLDPSGTSWRKGYGDSKQKGQRRGDCGVQKAEAKAEAREGQRGGLLEVESSAGDGRCQRDAQPAFPPGTVAPSCLSRCAKA